MALLRVLVLAGLAAGICLAAEPAGAAISREYQIKAVFLFNFPQFVDWPPAAFATDRSPLIIGVLGDDPFGAFLENLIRGEKVAGRPLAVQHFRSAEGVAACHVLFVSASEAGRYAADLLRLKGRSILTVGDRPGFLDDGGMICFATQTSRTRLRIDPRAAEAAGLKISSNLLRRAEIVGGGPPP